MPDDTVRGGQAVTKAVPKPGQTSLMPRADRPHAEFDAAAHAYHDADTRGAHRVDLRVGSPSTAPQSVPLGARDAAPEPRPQRVIHEVGSPFKTSFKLGFGFTAGAWSFRAIVQILIFGTLILVCLRLLSSLFG